VHQAGAQAEVTEWQHDDIVDRLGSVIAHLIVFVSIASAVVSWRASVFATTASDLDQAASQQLVQKQQLIAGKRGYVNEDLRLVAAFQEHLRDWRLLSNQAAASAARNPGLALRLQSQANAELAMARSLSQFFVVSIPRLSLNRLGLVPYNRGAALQQEIQQDPELPALDPVSTQQEAHHAHLQTVRLVGVAAILVLSLFFLTIAQVARPRVRRIFWPAGAAVMAAGVILFVLAELTY
jgi:hypothetical protein